MNMPEVTVTQRSPSTWDFTVEPQVAGMFLIKGTMLVTQKDQDGMSGNITAGFINLRSTLSGSWVTEGSDFNSTLHIHLNETRFGKE